MHKLILLSILTLFLTDCNPANKKDKAMEENTTSAAHSTVNTDTTPKVTGVGGIFFFSDNPKETREWYAKNLGVEVNDYGSSFESRNVQRPEEIMILQWSPFKKGSEYFAPSKKEFMINYRVQNIQGLVDKLKANGVTVVDEIQSFDYGKFVHIMDAEGNKIELWEPVDSISPLPENSSPKK
jgi:predicted enzyme related to lactoylglutathione lyase